MFYAARVENSLSTVFCEKPAYNKCVYLCPSLCTLHIYIIAPLYILFANSFNRIYIERENIYNIYTYIPTGYGSMCNITRRRSSRRARREGFSDII